MCSTKGSHYYSNITKSEKTPGETVQTPSPAPPGNQCQGGVSARGAQGGGTNSTCAHSPDSGRGLHQLCLYLLPMLHVRVYTPQPLLPRPLPGK